MKVIRKKQNQSETEFHAGDQIRVTSGNWCGYYMICQDYNKKFLLVTLGSTDKDICFNLGNATNGDGWTAAFDTDAVEGISELINRLTERYDIVEKVNLTLVEGDDA